MNDDELNTPITVVLTTGGISGHVMHDALHLDINWCDFDQRYIDKTQITSNNAAPFILTTDWANNVTKIDKLALVKELKEEILFDLQLKLDIKDNEPDNVQAAWRDVKDAVMAYIIAQKLAN